MLIKYLKRCGKYTNKTCRQKWLFLRYKKKNERMKETSIDVSMYKKNRPLFIELRICILYCTIEFLLLKRKKQKKRNGWILRDFNSKYSFFRRWPATRFESRGLLINDHQTHCRFILCPARKNSHIESNCIENVRFLFF